ncbi:OadG family protein, partial [Maledivibacter halophilus]
LSLLERFTRPEMLEQMTMGEKFLGSMYIAILGMAVTFIALMILWALIIIMGKALNTTKPKKSEVDVIDKTPAPELKKKESAEVEEEPEELVAIITAAIAASLGTSTHNIVVRNIVRTADTTPAWGRAGRVDQMNRML